MIIQILKGIIQIQTAQRRQTASRFLIARKPLEQIGTTFLPYPAE